MKSFSELHEAFARYRKSNHWIFRGQSNPEWLLVPKTGRPQYSNQHTTDLAFFDDWKRRAVEYVSVTPKDDWDWFAVAQHHGLATRLLDWTFNPLAATFFAVNEKIDSDGVVYAYHDHRMISTDKVSPGEIKGVFRFKPRGVAQRIVRQGGVFTVHGPPSLALDKALLPKVRLERVIIDKTYRKELLFELSHYGINSLTLFPDLDGLSGFVNWVISNSWYWSDREY